MSSRAFGDLRSSERAVIVALTAVRFVITFALVLVVFYLAPLATGQSVANVLGFLLVALVALVIMIGWQIRSIIRARFPTLRAIEGLGFALPFFLCAYAASYVVLASGDSGAFTEAMSRTDALYFAVVVFGTVGFGDIAPVSDPARLLVASQILLDLVFVALVVRVLFTASRRTISKRSSRHPAD